MIYFFDKDMELKKLVVSSNVYNPTHQQVKNGMILAQLEFDIDYAFMFIDKVEYFGYYYNETFYLHRIKTVEPDFAANIMTVAGNHIFFDDMIGYNYIKDKRPVNRDANFVLNDTIGEVTRWDIVMTDVTEPLSSSFYYLTPMEALEQIVKDYQVEYEPRILFDGKKINAYQLHVANKLGNKDAKRVRFGDKVLQLKYDIDYSDISTAIIGRGKGEEVGEGYGRRIDITGVSFSRNGVVSPTGKDYMEDPRITDLYGYDDGTPKYEIVIFEEIEDVNELAEATYNYYVEKSKPKMLFETEVTDIGIKHIGDSLLIVKPENNLAFKVRVEKIDVNLHNPEVPAMELGDYEYFQESKVERRNRLENQRIVNEYGSVITGMKRDFDARFDAIVEQWLGEFDQTKIDLSALIEQHRLEMTNLINTTRTNMENHFNSEVDRAFSEAETNYEIINTRITDEIDTARNAVINDINNATDLAISEAERITNEKTKTVQDNLDSFSNTHSKLLSDMSDRVTNIDNFLGDMNIGLDERFLQIQETFLDRLNNVESNTFNMIRGSRFDELNLYTLSGAVLRTEEYINYFKLGTTTANQPGVIIEETVNLEADKLYTYVIEYRTSDVIDFDQLNIYLDDGTVIRLIPYMLDENLFNLVTDGNWNKVISKFRVPNNMSGRLLLGTDFLRGNLTKGVIDFRLPYMTASTNTEWIYHPRDNTQSIEEVTRRITNLEDGTDEFITRTVYNAFTDSINGTIRNITDTVDGYKSIITNHNNWITQNGSSILQTVDEVTSKIWKNDIHNSNIIPYTDVTNVDNYSRFTLVGSADSILLNYTDWMRVRSWTGTPNSYMGVYTDYFEIEAGKSYTFSFESWESTNHNTTGAMNYTYITGSDINNIGLSNSMNRELIGSIIGANIFLNTVTFKTTESTKIARMLIGTRITVAGTMATFWFRHPKLEAGTRYTPYESSFSGLEQRVDRIGLSVQGIDGDMITQNDIIVDTERIVIGSQQIGGNNLASMLAISPAAMDIVTNALNITGNVNVKGQIQSLAMSAVKADFANLFAAQVKANTIDVDYISGRTAWFERLYVLSTNVERLTSQFIFTDAVTTKSLDAIEANIGRVRTAFLTADVISGTHIASNTISIKHLTGYDAILTTLMARTIFSNEIKTLSLEAVEADISNLRSKIITTGIIEATHLKTGLALVDRVFASNAMIERLTGKSAFLRDIRAITIDAVQINLQTIMNDMGKVEGGITIRRPDGAIFIENGINKFGVPIITKGYAGGTVEYDGTNYITNARGSQIFERAFCDHSGRYANFSFSIGMVWNADWASTSMAVVIRPANTPTGVNISTLVEEFMVYRDSGTKSVVMNVRLPKPTYGALSFTLEFYRIGDNLNNPITIRSNRCWISA